MARRRRLQDVPSRPAEAPCITAPAPAVLEALRLADGDRARLRVVPAPEAIGGAAVIVVNTCPGRRP